MSTEKSEAPTRLAAEQIAVFVKYLKAQSAKRPQPSEAAPVQNLKDKVWVCCFYNSPQRAAQMPLFE